MSTAELVVRVDERDRELGTCEKLDAHQGPGVLHRAFSVLLVDDRGRLLLQRRAAAKHHFRLRWSNACCSHPRPGESVSAAAGRRVQEELGVGPPLVLRDRFRYRATDPDSGLVEHEIDHVLVGVLQDDPQPDEREVGDWTWVDSRSLRGWLAARPHEFTPWFVRALDLGLPRWRTVGARRSEAWR